MIICGFPCIGKSSVSGVQNTNTKFQFIDLESSNLFYDVSGNGDYQRHEGWEECYVNIAYDLHKQGFNVFVSTHSAVINELNKRGIDFAIIVPDYHLKDKWIARASERYEKDKSEKNKKALDRITNHFKEDVEGLLAYGDNVLKLNTTEYDLTDVLYCLLKSTSKINYNSCAICAWATSGYCPVYNGVGCVSSKGKVISNIEFYENVGK